MSPSFTSFNISSFSSEISAIVTISLPIPFNFLIASANVNQVKFSSKRRISKSLSLSISNPSKKLLNVITSYSSFNSFLIFFSNSLVSEIAKIDFCLIFPSQFIVQKNNSFIYILILTPDQYFFNCFFTLSIIFHYFCTISYHFINIFIFILK